LYEKEKNMAKMHISKHLSKTRKKVEKVHFHTNSSFSISTEGVKTSNGI